jgi:hypothetical protein
MSSRSTLAVPAMIAHIGDISGRQRMGCALEGQVRNGLFAGAKGIRTDS